MHKPVSSVPAVQPYAYAYGSPPQPQLQVVTAGFFSPLGDCCSDLPLCCITCWCPCITFGRNAEIIDKGTTSCGVSGTIYGLILGLTGCCQWIYGYSYRTKLKAQYGMPESCFGDCCTHFWCSSCALCQEYRELQHRGYNPTLGWHGNMEKQNRGMAMLPTQNSVMAMPVAIAIPLTQNPGMGTPPTEYPGMRIPPTMPGGMTR